MNRRMPPPNQQQNQSHSHHHPQPLSIQPQPAIQPLPNNSITPVTPQNQQNSMFGNQQNMSAKSQSFPSPQINNLYLANINVPQIKFPNLKRQKFFILHNILQNVENLKNEISHLEAVYNDYIDLKDQLNSFISDKAEFQKQYIKYFELCYNLNFEVQKQKEIINNYQNLVNKIFQKVPQSEHPLIQQCLDQIKNIEKKSSSNSANSMHHEKPHGKTRGRPKSKTDDSKEGLKRIKYEEVNYY
ncbi:hypothetical protein LY90DRAFT_517010 [Neocallimastix californiae]|uniref:Groucho/TLE N-terminal Q-rich domain-containing protein n=1 Tax=Neocallimastix californiae TaxID=1754190 RepID=A0A1Y2ACY2_9FUNG|nr:hypothetical protein LY90DRAFT_517010 [Neocallimastix californiae]|eukprot:ORY20150.1 hypothetical protein LY90DRAFT_517010 [Neocallimastix californiae]